MGEHWQTQLCTDVVCDARVNPNTGELFSVFDEPNASCDKCGEVELDVVETDESKAEVPKNDTK